MYSIKGSSSFVGKTFAFSKSNDSGGGKKLRIRRSKEERKNMVESFIKNYQELNNGNFPSVTLTHKEVGGSFYTVREIVREIIQENRVLGPGMLTSGRMSADKFMVQYPLGSISVEPQILMSSDEDITLSRHHEVTSEGVVIISEVDHELPSIENGKSSDSVQVVVGTEESDGITSKEPKAADNSEAEYREKQSVDNGHITHGFLEEVKGSKFDESAISELQESEIARADFHEQKAVDIGNAVGSIQADSREVASNGQAGKELRVSETSEANIQELQSVDNLKIISKIQVEVNSSVSNELVSTESQENTTKADNVYDKQNIDNGRITDGIDVDIKSSKLDEPVNKELQEIGILDEDGPEHQSATNGHVTNGRQLGVQTQGSDELTGKEFQGVESSKGSIDAKVMIKSSAKVTQIIEDVVVETFPIRPTTKQADSKDTNSGNGRNLPKTSEDKEDPKVELGARSSSRHANAMSSQNVSGKQKEPTAAGEATSPPINDHARVLNGTVANSNARKPINQETNLVKAKADSDQSNAGFQKESNATLDRMDLQSWEQAAKTSGKQGTNPLLAIFRAFVHAFVNFWSE